jgi:hypothetical protein
MNVKRASLSPLLNDVNWIPNELAGNKIKRSRQNYSGNYLIGL